MIPSRLQASTPLIERALQPHLSSSGRILISPLDWGLGHATRCIPLIGSLLELGHIPVLAATDGPLQILREAFPDLEYSLLESQKIRHSGNAFSEWSIALQSVRYMLTTFRAERRQTAELADRKSIDLIVSDNRYGCRAEGVPSVIMTHQLNPQAALPGASRAATGLVARLIDPFDACWIPDFDGPDNLSGLLSDVSGWKGREDMDFHFLGPLSRFGRKVGSWPDPGSDSDWPVAVGSGDSVDSDGNPLPAAPFDVMMIVSGPDPAASDFRRKLRNQAFRLSGRVLLVEGLPSDHMLVSQTENLTVVNHLPPAQFEHFLRSAKMVVCRSGYSSLMDLEALGKCALLVPTPHQAEQQYLAERAAVLNRHDVAVQSDFDLGRLIAQMQTKN